MGRLHAVAVQLLLPLGLCMDRVKLHTNNPSLQGEESPDEVCKRLFNEFVIASNNEGFSEVLTVRSHEEIPFLEQRLLQLFVPFSSHSMDPVSSFDWHLPDRGHHDVSHHYDRGGHSKGRHHRSHHVRDYNRQVEDPYDYQQPHEYQHHQDHQQVLDHQGHHREKSFSPTWQQQQWPESCGMPSHQLHQPSIPQPHSYQAPASSQEWNQGYLMLQSGRAQQQQQQSWDQREWGRDSWVHPQRTTRKPSEKALEGQHLKGSRHRGEDNAVAALSRLFADPNCRVPYDDLPSKVIMAISPATSMLNEGVQSVPVDYKLLTQGSDFLERFLIEQNMPQSPSWELILSQARQQQPVAMPDTRIILLFDLNGTLTSHTSSRHSSGVSKPRPFMKELLRLKPMFRLGIFTSATVRTVASVRRILEDAAGVQEGGLFEPGLILYRDHCDPAPPGHVKDGSAKSWDTVKPLSKWFKRLNRVVLFDDEQHKALPGEELNLVQVPCWDDRDNSCTVVKDLVELVLQVLTPLHSEGNVTEHTAELSQKLMAEPTDDITSVVDLL